MTGDAKGVILLVNPRGFEPLASAFGGQIWGEGSRPAPRLFSFSACLARIESAFSGPKRDRRAPGWKGYAMSETMVDAWGASAHCEQCNLAVDESDLQEWDNGDELCSHCFGLLSDLADILGTSERL